MKKIASLILILFFILVKVNAQNFWLAKTTGKLPELAYGLGGDRLGGAKMGYIDTGVLVKVVDSVGVLYKLDLCKNQIAYINKTDIIRNDSLQLKPFYLTNSFKASGADSLTYDLVQIGLDERLPYKSWMQTEPACIQVQLFGVQSNTNWITHLTNAKIIKQVYYQQLQEDLVQVTIDLNQANHWGYSISYEGKRLLLKIKKQPKANALKKLNITIDAGHGGTNTGARGVKTNLAEKDLTLLFAQQLYKVLTKAGFENVNMIRDTDTGVEMKDRVILAKNFETDLLISLHLNSAARKEVNGVSTYFKHVAFKPVTEKILNELLELPLNEFGNIGSFNFTLNAPTDFINCLVEIAFLSNEDDEKKIINPKFQNQVAKKIKDGIVTWYKSLY
jgi:N-acetylmuramoyl-L-alanine amidase